MKVKSESEVISHVQLLAATPWTTRPLYPWDFPGKSTGVGYHCLLWNTLRHLVTKLTIIKNKTLQAIRGKDNIQENSHNLSADFSIEILQARRGWYHIYKVMKGKNLQLRIL